MPNAPKTPHRQVRMDEELWTDLGQLAESLGLDRSALLRSCAEWLVRRPGAKLPQRSQ